MILTWQNTPNEDVEMKQFYRSLPVVVRYPLAVLMLPIIFVITTILMVVSLFGEIFPLMFWDSIITIVYGDQEIGDSVLEHRTLLDRWMDLLT